MKQKSKFHRSIRLLAPLIVMLAQGCGNLHNSATPIEVNAVIDFMSQHEDAVILDVRTPTEYEESHITGAVNVSMQDDAFEDLVAMLDPHKQYIVHCSDNHYVGRSNYALKSMQKLGFKNLYSLAGGYESWKGAGLPLTKN